jgi:uncharacterized protein YyaL (SSP411 family)
MANRLASATSPYLLQHATNPVDWREWGREAFDEAIERDVPVLLSVGYSACHWCHVMAHESFEDPETAEYMNQNFVSVKVDREERPDVDRIYMDAVQAMTGRGGWPMTVFMDGEGRPFFAGTYYPKDDRHGHPSFRRVMESIVHAWHHRRPDITQQSQRLTEAVSAALPPGEAAPDAGVVQSALAALLTGWDRDHGGFGGAPKFPQVPTVEFILRAVAMGAAGPHEEEAIAAITMTLDRMARGGIHDHLGGGFARYSVDREWLVPHFEKMLYDNALLARLYLRAGQVTGHGAFTEVAESTLDYLIRDMTHPSGGLFSAEDADSEGVEGKFYVWSWGELEEVLADDRRWAAEIYGASPAGNFEGDNILHRYRPLEDVAAANNVTVQAAGEARRRIDIALSAARSRRIRPGLDDKVVTAWNGLGLWAFAEAASVLRKPRYLEHARRVGDFLLEHLRRHDGRLLRSWRDGRVSGPGFSDDYGASAMGLFALYQATGEVRWFRAAEEVTRDMIDLFADRADGGFFATGHDAEKLITRPKDQMDNPTPSGSSLALEAIQVLAAFTGDQDLLEHRESTLRASARLIERYPSAAGHTLSALVTGASGMREVAIVGRERTAMEEVVFSAYRPDLVVASSQGEAASPPLLVGRTSGPGEAPMAYVCRDFVCDLPVDTTEGLAERLGSG